MKNFCSIALNHSIPQSSRLLFLDTETTGLMSQDGHRVVEIAIIEYIESKQIGRVFHSYLNPQRDIDSVAEEVHGLTLDFLSSKPKFEDVADDIVQFITGSVLVIHNAPFDLSFLDTELKRVGKRSVNDLSYKVIDSLILAKSLRPGKKNSLDALCLEYGVDISRRTLHSALLDAELLAEVFFKMSQSYAVNQ